MDRDCADMQAKLAALADGTLAPSERDEVLRQVGRQPELAGALQAQRDALSVLARVEGVRAPESLHRSVESIVRSAAAPAPAPRRRRSRRLRLQVAAAGALAAAALAITLAGTTSPGPPTVLRAAQAALRPSTLPAPAPSPTRRGKLRRSVDGIAYPYWQDGLGWRATGARTDSLDGRLVSTVFYAPERGTGSASRRIGYAIVAGDALAMPAGGMTIESHGIRFRALHAGNATILTWRRAGHTCILVARGGVSTATLVRLASWA
jgi:hypothetical protein